MKNLALWVVSLISLAVAATSLVFWMRTPKANDGELVLRDEAGRPRIRLVATGGAPKIELLDEKAHVRAALLQSATDTSLRLYRPDSPNKAIDVIAHNGDSGPTSGASLSAYSPDGKRISTVGAADSAWLALRTPGAEIHMSQEPTRSEIGALFIGNSAKLEVSENEARFTTRKAFSVDAPQVQPSP